MAPRCRSTWKTAHFVCFILTAVIIPITFAKPFQSEEFTLSQSDVHYYTTSPDYEYVKPVRLGSRHQRSAEETSVTSTSEYSVEGFDQVFHIQLKESTDLFNAGLLVKRISVDGQVRVEQPATGCYHQGYLMDNEHTTSVSLSTCNGLVGMIRTPEADFALKPLKEDHILKMKSEEDEVPTHIMYKVSPADMAISQVNSENERRRASDPGIWETSGTKYVETSVVADSAMFDYHGDDTEFYLFTILNQVAGLFRDRSLSADLRLLITSITILEAPQSNLDLTDELSHSLKNFCEWQKEGTSDISILLTRRDLEIGGNDAVTGKSKDVGGACDPSRRCIIAQDHGPSGTIFTLAHEIGHSLGMYHDDVESGCANNKNIMATDNSGGSEAFKWSLCSDKDLLQFLSTSDSACLDETQDDFPAYNSETVVMPGHFYDALKQCQMTFGSEATVADGYIYSQDMCLELECMIPGRSEPITNHIPALDGTKCGSGRGMICVHGQCLRVVSMYDCEGGLCVPEWLTGSYGDCQTDCFTYRNVFCVERRLDGTTVLVPDMSRCPEDKPAEMEYCCETPPVGESSYRILSSQCSVTCGTGSETRVLACVDLEGNVVDDSFCTDERPPDVIECAPAPCPGVTYILFYDNYGECSVTCDTGVESRNAFCATSAGVSESVEICRLVFASVVTERTCNLGTCPGTVVDTFFYQTSPNGTCSVTCGEGVQELSVFCRNLAGMTVDDFNCVSLERPASSQICTQEDCTDTYRYVATSFGGCSVSCGSGVRTRSIFCLNEANQVVDDSFCAGLVRQTESESCNLASCTITYTYEAQPFPECTLPCGSQSFSRSVICRSSEGDVVSSTNCVDAGLEAPATTFDCNLEPCGNYVYVVGEYGQCSATCGIGVQQRSVSCVDLDDNNQTVSNTLCSETAPPSAILCDQGDCPTEYMYLTSTFSECNCAGIQTRFVVCITFMNGAPIRATDQDCIDAGLQQPTDSQPCEAPSTCNPVWRIGAWSACSVSCGNGVQTRVVYCVESEESNVIVPSTSCDPDSEPASVQICNPGECITYTWVSENFGECSVTCGEGVRVRNVLCYAIAGGSFQPVEGSLCNPALEPPSEEICDLEECGGVYEATPWSACSVTCALGVQTREVSCVTRKGSGIVIAESDCSNMTRPSESRECYLDPCPLPYGCDQSYATEGSITYTLQSPGYPVGYPADLECSKILVAPEDNIIRITFTDLQLEEGCAYDAVRLIDLETNSINSLCDEVDLPYVYESTSPMLEVLFLTDATVSRRGFSATYQAVRATALDYMTGEWEECSVTCGVGTESRDVTCVEEGLEVDVSRCVGLPVPPATRPCTQEDCPLPGACGENILRFSPGLITSPEFPSAYPENVTCVNTIQAPPGNVISFDFGFLVLINQGVLCEDGDSITIQDTSSREQVIPLCQNAPSEITTLTNEVSVTFVSDNAPAPQGTGFTLQYFSVSPEVDICGGNVTTSGQPIYSPNYPANYDDNVTCVTDITNDEGCISIEFLMMDIDNGDYVNAMCREDSLTITDYNNPSLSQTYCYDSAPESRWLSASGNVQVSFTSNGANSSQGYIAIPTFVECPEAFWVPLPFGNCSEICGDGNRTRELECRNALTNELADSDECPDEEPPRTEPCFIEDCPSCDVRITEGNSNIEFPINDDYYLYNDECTLTITNENGCMNLFFIYLDIDEGLGDTCYNDYLMTFDPSNVYASKPYCGNAINTRSYQTLGNTVELTLRTEDADRFKSFQVFPSFGSCLTFAFVPGPWSECSLSCDGGVRTRDVPCLNLLTRTPDLESMCEGSISYETMEECNTEECPVCSENVIRPGVIVSPGFSTDDRFLGPAYDEYDNNLNCLYNITNPISTECITVSFISFDLGQSSENCSDYVQITDTEGGEYALYCGLPENTTVPVFYSRSANVEVVLRTGEDEGNKGFEALINFRTCPEFGFFTGNFSECSVTCGEGIEYRDVECRQFSTGQPFTYGFCRDQRPADSRPCSLPECPSCDRVLTEEGIFSSPNNPMNYEDNQECEYTLISGEDQCIRVTFLGNFKLGLSNDDCEDGDYIELSDENWEYLDATYCGDRLPPIWRSRSNESSLTFYSDGEDTFRGFTAYLAFVTCPQYGFTVGEYGECDASCGSGVQMREVECTDLTTQDSVAMGLCTDPMPPTTRECNDYPCPSCDETYTRNNVSFERDDFMDNEECLYNVTSLEGQCVRISVAWNLSPPPNGEDECTGDSLKIVDAAYPYRAASLCGRDDDQFISYGSTSLIYFTTDDEDRGGGFQIFTEFVDCPEYGFTASNFSECSASCGNSGFRTRDVLCTRLETGENVSRENCNETDTPSNYEPCNRQPCFDCNMFFADSGRFVSPEYPSDYPENLQCVYDFANQNNECWKISAIDFDLQDEENGQCRDRFSVEDVGFGGRREPYVACGDELSPVLSFSGTIRITFFTDDEYGGRGFDVLVISEACPVYGFLAGPYSEECSATCGEGVVYRNVTCQDLMTREVVNDSLCSDLRPSEIQPCRQEPCPSCDVYVTEDAQYISSPNYPQPYDNDGNCTTFIIAPEGMCINLFIISFELQEPDIYAGCVASDFLAFTDTILAVDPYFAVDQIYCGNQENILWFSSQNYAVLSFFSDEEGVYPGYQIYSSFVDCQQYFYLVTPFEECSVSCGLGEQRRDIFCVDRYSNDTVSDDLCSGDVRPIETLPCFIDFCPEGCDSYILENNQTMDIGVGNSPNEECEYVYVNVEDGCNRLDLYVNLPPPNTDGECDRDYLVFHEDAGDYEREFVICGNVTLSFTSRSNVAELTFVSDGMDNETFDGFSVSNFFVDCPVYGYIADEEYGECDVTCGGGMQTRNVSCFNLSNSTVVNDSLCADARPEEFRSCGEEPCPGCDRNFNWTRPSLLVFRSDVPYSPSSTCTNALTTNVGMCLRVAFYAIDIEESEDCVNDSLVIADPNNEAINFILCQRGGVTLPIFSTSNMLTLTLTSDSSFEGDGYTALASRIDCPNVTWVAEDIGSCSVSCGAGIQSRNVYCMNQGDGTQFAQEESCTGQRPAEMVPCDLGDCPQGCDRNFNWTRPSLLVFRSDVPYSPSSTCTNALTTNVGMCLRVAFYAIDIEESEDCVNDSLVIADPNNEAINFILCQRGGVTLPIFSTSNMLTLTLTSDSSFEGDGYTALASRIDCPNVTWVAEDIGSCSVSCGAGIQSRNVYCMNQGDGTQFAQEESCTGQRPAEMVPCDLGDCPQGCDRNINWNRPSLLVFRSDVPYSPSSTCTNALTTNVGMCLRVAFNAIDIEESEDCVNDSLVIADPNNEAINFILCQRGGVTLPIFSTSNMLTLTLTSDSSFEGDGYSALASSIDCPNVTWVAEDIGSCSVSCGAGIQSRNVYCMNQGDGTQFAQEESCTGQRPAEMVPCDLGDCPQGCDRNINWNRPSLLVFRSDVPYSPSSTCTNALTTNVGMCLRVAFNAIDIEESEDCVNDSLVIADPNNEAINFILCQRGGVTLPIFSTSNMLTLTLTSDSSFEGDGYSALASSIDCPNVTWVAEDIGSCSVSCGAGIQSRNVYCMNQGDGTQFAQEESCTGQRPAEMVPCDLGDCPQGCDRNINWNRPSLLVFRSDVPYSPSSTCTNALTTNVGMCLRVAFNAIDIEESEDCVNDSLVIADPNNEAINFILCQRGGVTLPIFSTSNMLTLTLTSDSSFEGDGYSALASSIDCPNVTWVAEDIGSCSVSCGAGIQSRNVYCMNQGDGTQFAQEESCTGQRPAEMVPCDLGDCPQGCDRNFNWTRPSLLVFRSDVPYSPSSTCTNALTTNVGMCLRVAFYAIDIEESEDCVNDSLVIADPNNEAINFILCQRGGVTLPIFSTSNMLTLTLTSDSSFEGDGYTALASRIDCPNVTWVAEDIGSCSVSCGAGIQSRNVYCMNQGDGTQFAQEESCTGQRPAEMVPCDLGDCPQDCNYTINGASMISGNLSSPNYPNSSPSELSCPITFIIPQGSVLNFRIIEFNLDATCSEYIKLTGAVAGETLLCSNDITLPTSATYTSDSMVSFLYVTDNDDSNTAYYFAEWQFISILP